MNKQNFLNLMARGKAAKRNGVDLQHACPLCFGVLSNVFDNNGFDAPDPTFYEVTGLKCSVCGYKE